MRKTSILVLTVMMLLAFSVQAFGAGIVVTAGTGVLCNAAKKEIVSGQILPGDSFRYTLFVAANATDIGPNTTTTTCTHASYTGSNTGELATLAATGYTQTGISKTDGAWSASGNAWNFTNAASQWTSVSTAPVFDTIVVYDDSCTGSGKCTNADQIVAIFVLASSFTGPSTGTYTVTPPANMISITKNEITGETEYAVNPPTVTGMGAIALQRLKLIGAAPKVAIR